MSHPWVQLLIRWSILALGVTLASHLVPGIRYDSPTTLLVVVLLLSFLNAVLRPLLVLFTLPFILLTMGVGVLVINALLFLFVGRLVGGFEVGSFWSALGGSVIVSLTNLILSSIIGPRPPPRPPRSGRRGGAPAPDVIDV